VVGEVDSAEHKALGNQQGRKLLTWEKKTSKKYLKGTEGKTPKREWENQANYRNPKGN